MVTKGTRGWGPEVPSEVKGKLLWERRVWGDWKAGKMVVVQVGPRFRVITGGGQRGTEVRGLRDWLVGLSGPQ